MTLSLYSEPQKQGTTEYVIFRGENSARAPDGAPLPALSMQPDRNCLPQRSRKTAFLDQYAKPSKQSAKMVLHRFTSNTVPSLLTGLCDVSLLPCYGLWTHAHQASLLVLNQGFFFFFFFKSQKNLVITRQSVVKLNFTHRGQFGKHTPQAFLKSKICEFAATPLMVPENSEYKS